MKTNTSGLLSQVCSEFYKEKDFIMLGIKGFVCIGILTIELLGLLYVFCDSSFSKILQTQNLPITFYIFFVVIAGITLLLFYQKKICYYFNALLRKHCIPEAELQNTKQDENIEKLQEKLQIPQKESSITIQSIKNITTKKEKEEFENIFKWVEIGKYELVVSKIQEKLKSNQSEKIEFLCIYDSKRRYKN